MTNIEIVWQVPALGMLVVLSALFLLYIILDLFSRALTRFVESGKRKGGDTAPPVSADRPSSRDMISEDNGRDPRLMAAITAAVHTFLAGDGIFKSRITITPAEPYHTPGGKWGLAARKSLLEGRTEIENLRRRRLREKI